MKSTFLLVVATLAFAGTATAQTPTPNPTPTVYDQDTAALKSANTLAAWNAGPAALAQTIITAQGAVDPSLSDQQAASLYSNALQRAASFLTSPAARVAFLKPFIAAAQTSSFRDLNRYLVDNYTEQEVQSAQKAMAAGDFAGALATASDSLLLSGPKAARGIMLIAAVKARTQAADALSWARLAYCASAFADSQAGINAVTSAFRATDKNLSRANAFISSQTDPAAANPLTGVNFPTLPASVALNQSSACLGLIFSGDNVGALRAAMADYIAAGTNADLNAAVAEVAFALRDVDGNLIRANAWVSAQKAGATFTISELTTH